MDHSGFYTVELSYGDFRALYEAGMIDKIYHGQNPGTGTPISSLSAARFVREYSAARKIFAKAVGEDAANEVMERLRRESDFARKGGPLYSREDASAIGFLAPADYAYLVAAATGAEDEKEAPFVTTFTADKNNVRYKVVWEPEKFRAVLDIAKARITDAKTLSL